MASSEVGARAGCNTRATFVDAAESTAWRSAAPGKWDIFVMRPARVVGHAAAPERASARAREREATAGLLLEAPR